MKKEILVYGWYNHNNIGDNLFCDAFRKLFPELGFTFVDILTIENVKKASAIFIGGGSLLDGNPSISDECFDLLKTKKVLYLGIGTETGIHKRHKELMKSAKLIALRSTVGLEKIKWLNDKVMIIPDLVYALKSPFSFQPNNNSILILPNISTIPQNGDPHWKYDAWSHFKFEFSQFLDYLRESSFQISFFPMCSNKKQNDNWAIAELVGAMKYRNDFLISQLSGKYEFVITQRYHGVILSEMAQVPYISIFHHDKLKKSYLNKGAFMSYFSSSKQDYIDQFHLIRKQMMPIGEDIFDDLVIRVNSILDEG